MLLDLCKDKDGRPPTEQQTTNLDASEKLKQLLVSVTSSQL